MGHLRGDFGRDGDEFWCTWFDHDSELKTPKFKKEFDQVISQLRESSILKDRATMRSICNASPEAAISMHNDYGFRYDTNDYSYYIRAMLEPGGYNFYCYCYNRAMLEQRLGASRQEPGQSGSTAQGQAMSIG